MFALKVFVTIADVFVALVMLLATRIDSREAAIGSLFMETVLVSNVFLIWG